MRRLGRKPRSFNARIPHFSALRCGSFPFTIPHSVDYTAGMAEDWGMMGNDALGDCTCAAYYHARQVWSFNAGGEEITDPDDDVIGLYKNACGYDPANSSTDQGGVEQAVLTYLVNHGAVIGSRRGVDRLLAFVEIDPRNQDDIRRAIYDCGVAYIGINLPANIMAGEEPPAVWQPEGAAIVGGHAVILAGYDSTGFTLVSWGKTYRMTNEFFAQYTEEAYALADRTWATATGKTPLGMTLDQLEFQMQALKQYS